MQRPCRIAVLAATFATALLVLPSIALTAQGRGDGQTPRATEIPPPPRLQPPPAPRQPATTPVPPAPTGDGKTIFNPQSLALGTAAPSTVDAAPGRYYKIQAPPAPRDWLSARVENRSTTLRPCIVIYDADRNRVNGDCNGNPSANYALAFRTAPNATYLVQVSGYADSAGDFTLTVTPMKSFDAFEPNDEFATAKEIKLSAAVSGLNIMDDADLDFFRVVAGSSTSLTASVDNQSTTLKPCIIVFDVNKNRVAGDCDGNAGANFSVSAEAKSGSTYFIQISGYSSSTGKYTLTIK